MINKLNLRRPESTDGVALHKLVRDCPPLDENSLYCNLLQVTHFADTAIVAEHDGKLVGFVTGYIPPGKDNVLFVWQVAVAKEARGSGLADRMMRELVARHPQVTMLETTVTPDNIASAKAFERFASAKDAPIQRSVLFSRDLHFGGQHDDEVLFTIGPFNSQGGESASRSVA